MYKRNNMKIMIGAFIGLGTIMLVTLIYATFTGQLNINGSAVGRESKWDIHFENVSSITTSGTSKVLNSHQPVINSNNPTQIQDYEVSLTSPSDSISFTFDVVNDGNYNAKITSVNVGTPECTSTDTVSATNMCNNLTYSITYASGTIIQTNDLVYAKDKVTMKVTLTFNDISDASLLPTVGVSISNLGITINIEQQGNALVNETTGEVANNKVYHQGTKITLDNEDYYIIADSGADQDYVVALKDDSISSSVMYGSTSDYSTSNVKTVIDDWVTDTFQNNELKEVNSYVARLITHSEYLSLSSSYSWKSPNYLWWTMTPYTSTTLYFIDRNGITYEGTANKRFLVVRPVINVYKSALETNNNNNNE